MHILYLIVSFKVTITNFISIKEVYLIHHWEKGMLHYEHPMILYIMIRCVLVLYTKYGGSMKKWNEDIWLAICLLMYPHLVNMEKFMVNTKIRSQLVINSSICFLTSSTTRTLKAEPRYYSTPHACWSWFEFYAGV